MPNITINSKKETKVEKTKVKDELELLEDVSHLLFNSFAQTQETPAGVFFISNSDLEDLPNKLVKLIDERLENVN